MVECTFTASRRLNESHARSLTASGSVLVTYTIQAPQTVTLDCMRARPPSREKVCRSALGKLLEDIAPLPFHTLGSELMSHVESQTRQGV
eukprot:4491769-Amphidinium_carterae.2